MVKKKKQEKIVMESAYNFGSRLRLMVPSNLANCISTSSSPDVLIGFEEDATGTNGVGVDCISDELYNF